MEPMDRRRVALMGAASLAVVAFGCGEKSPARDVRDEKKDDDKGDDVAPPEDLMREHGALNRVLLIYEESARRLETEGPPLPLDALTGAAGIIRDFIENYHEKLEEDFLFPRFEKAGKLVDLVVTLRRQHQAGRRLTEEIQRLATLAGIQDEGGKKKLVGTIRSFVRMYRPHEAREDTVLFPALRSIVEPTEFKALGEQFEEKEHQLFGKEGFEGVVAQVAKIEESLGINDLDQFTPS
jgi:hemerythrin-like domain-containing protein